MSRRPGLPAGPPTGSRRWFWLGVAVGVPFMVIGAAAVLHDNRAAQINFGVWFVGGALVHDVVFAPLVLLGGWALRRVLPGTLLAPAQWAIVLTAFVALFALIPLVGWGSSPREPTVQPLNYPAGVALLVGAIWLAAACRFAVLRHRARAGAR